MYLAIGVVLLVLFNVLFIAALRVLDRERDDEDE